MLLLGIFAHPDDESFGPGGTLARYARTGVDVHVCIATDGAVGAYDPALLAASGCNTLAELRANELACACRELGVTLHQLGYRDSGMGGSDDNAHDDSLHQAELEAVAHDVAALIRQLQPQVVLTHDPTGDYFHPDHIKVNLAVMRAIDLLQPAERPHRLYVTALPKSQVVWWVRVVRLMGQDPKRFGENKDIDLTRIGTPNDQIQARVRVDRYLDVKSRASACHRSQGGSDRPGFIPAFIWRWLARYEYFVQAYPPGATLHDDLLAGL